MNTGVESLEQSLREARDWVNATAQRMNVRDAPLAYRSLRATLHAIRGQLGTDQALAFAGRLPPLIRAIYFEGWRRADPRKPVRSKSALMTRVERDFDGRIRVKAERAAKAALETLCERLPARALSDVVKELPEDLAELWPDSPPPYTDLRIMAPPEPPPVDESRRARTSPSRLRRATRRGPGERVGNALPERHQRRARPRARSA
jgi:uncharacterized protein (DUF2267 family)